MPFCSNCGTKLEEGAKFCPQCGTPTAGSPATTSIQTNQSSNKARIKFATPGKNMGVTKFATRFVVINADTKKEICRTYGGEIITVEAPMKIGLDNLGLRKYVYDIEPGKKYEASVVSGLPTNKFVVYEVDNFNSD